MAKVAVKRTNIGDTLWAKVLTVVPTVTGVDVYLHRTNANQYEVFRKVHATGPYWAKYVYSRYDAMVSMEITGAYTGVPNPATDVPSDWSTQPNTLVMDTTAEVVLYGSIAGGNKYGWGSVHGYETLDAEAWYVAGVETTLSDGQWAHGSTVKLVDLTHYTEPDTSDRVCNRTKTHTISAAKMYINRDYVYNWLMDWTLDPNGNVFPMMLEPRVTTLSRVNWSVGGTDAVMPVAEPWFAEVSCAAACWNPDNAAILACWIDFIRGLRYHTFSTPFLNSTTDKLYWRRTPEVNGALAGSSWNFSSRVMALDNCGNHFLKTT